MAVQQGQDQPTLLRAPVPFEDGYLALEMEARSLTNVEGFILPREVTFSSYSLDLTVKPPRRYLSTEKLMVVNEIRCVSGPISLPVLPGVAVVTDWRFREKGGRPYHYQATNDTWVLRSDPDPEKTLAGKPEMPIFRLTTEPPPPSASHAKPTIGPF